MAPEPLENSIADALIGIDTLWGGDVMNPSGVGRFIADSWFSDQPLPRAYTHATAAACAPAAASSVRRLTAARSMLTSRSSTCVVPSRRCWRAPARQAECAARTWRAWGCAAR